MVLFKMVKRAHPITLYITLYIYCWWYFECIWCQQIVTFNRCQRLFTVLVHEDSHSYIVSFSCGRLNDCLSVLLLLIFCRHGDHVPTKLLIVTVAQSTEIVDVLIFPMCCENKGLLCFPNKAFKILVQLQREKIYCRPRKFEWEADWKMTTLKIRD